MQDKLPVVIAGAGPAGPSIALLLRRFDVDFVLPIPDGIGRRMPWTPADPAAELAGVLASLPD